MSGTDIIADHWKKYYMASSDCWCLEIGGPGNPKIYCASKADIDDVERMLRARIESMTEEERWRCDCN